MLTGGRVIVVGAGLSGMTCAVTLAEAGFEVQVMARDLPGESASSIAVTPWLPPPARWGAQGADRGRRSLAVLTELAAPPAEPAEPAAPAHHGPGDGSAGTGVVMRPGVLISPTGAESLTVPLISPLAYLRHLRERLLAAGGSLTRLWVPALPATGTVVNCTAVASRALAGDDLVGPRADRVVRFEASAGPRRRCWSAVPAEGLLTVRTDHHVEVSGPAGFDAGELRDLARRHDPEALTASAVVLGERVVVRGERERPAVRLDASGGDASGGDGGRRLVHCYGFGRYDLSVSWGCADDVVRLLV